VTVLAFGHAPRSVSATPAVESPPLVEVTLDASAGEPERWVPEDRAPGATLEGRVRDAQTGRPVLKFRVLRFHPDGSEGHPPLVTGAGEFLFRDVEEGPWVLRVEAPGYEPLERRIDADAAADSGPLDLRLVRGAEARVRCRDASGAPLEDGKVRFLGAGRSVEGAIDPEGTVILRGLRAGVAYEVTCAQSPATGLPRWLVPEPFGAVTLPASDEPVSLDLAFQTAGVASIRVRSAHLGYDEHSDTPEQRETRRATRATLVDAHGRTVWLRSRLVGSGWSVIVPPGPYTLRVEVPGAARFERPVTLAPLTTAATPTIDVEVP
jgi:hypothetical protein